MFKLLVLDKNTTICKLFVLDYQTWYHITLCKKKLYQNVYITIQ